MSVRNRLIIGSVIEFVIVALLITIILLATSAADRSDDQVRFSLQRLSDAQAVAKYAGFELDKADDLEASRGTLYEKKDYNPSVAASFASWENSLKGNIKLSGNTDLGRGQASELLRVESLSKTFSTIGATVDAATEASDRGDVSEAVVLATKADDAYRQTFVPGLESAIVVEQANAARADANSKSSSNTARLMPLIFAPVGLVVIALISALLMRDVTSSIDALKDGALKMGAGELDTRIDTGRKNEFKEVADAFNRMAAELSAVTRELRQYAHTVSHDLKGPLSTAMLAAGLLKDEAAKSGIRPSTEGVDISELADLITNNVARAVDLTSELLELAEAGQTPVDLTNVSVSAVVTTILDEKRQAIEGGGIEIKVSGDLGVIHANEAHAYQLFANLIDNAIKYCRVDSPVIAIDYVGDDPDGAHRYVVRDNGPGIAPSSLGHLFEPFFKGESGGTGIGLATVEKIVKVYGGEITARNDEGAVFEFTMRDSASQRTQPD